MYTKASEITPEIAANYIKEEYANLSKDDSDFLESSINIAKNYISTQTGLPLTSSDSTVTTIDSFPEMVFATLVLVKEMWDNGNLHVDNDKTNLVVSSCIDAHRINFL